jgi:hypothetical protein
MGKGKKASLDIGKEIFMKKALFSFRTGALLFAFLLIPPLPEMSTAGVTGLTAPPLFEFRYHDYAESTAILKGLAAEYPRLCRLYSIGKTETGLREIWCLEVGNRESGLPLDKPAVYFDGNQHDIEVIGGEATLYLAHLLLTGYGKDPEITRLVDSRIVYIIQRADPDGADAFLKGKIDWDPAEIDGQEDADGDGRFGEDGPQDINGDGEILQMRIPDPQGEWTVYDRDPRIMVKRADDSKGPFFKLLDEGIDNDGDGLLNEDPPKTRFISNRNYPAFWSSEDGSLRGAGDYPLQEHSARLLVDFILSHPHISQVESYHSTSGIFVRPLGCRPDSLIPRQDLRDYAAVLSRGTEMTGYPEASLYHEFSTIDAEVPPDRQTGARRGVFVDYAYWLRGLFSVTTELWSMEPIVNAAGWDDIPRASRLHSIPGNYRRPDVQTAILRWLDQHGSGSDLAGQGFIDWKPYDHPTHGKVELGGFTKFWLFNAPPGPYLRRVLEDQARFAVYRALLTPCVRIKGFKAGPDPSAPESWIVTAEAANLGYFDTSMEQGRRSGVAKPDRMTLRLPEGAKTRDPTTIELPFMRGTRGGSYVSLYRGTWRVQAARGTVLTVEIRSEKGGVHRKEVTLSSRGGA